MFWGNFQTTNHTFDLVPSLFFNVDQEQIFTLNSLTMAVCMYYNSLNFLGQNNSVNWGCQNQRQDLSYYFFTVNQAKKYVFLE